MSAKPTQFDGAYFGTLSDAQKTEYLLDIHEGIRDSLAASIDYMEKGGAFVPPAGFTADTWVEAVRGQLASQNDTLKKAGRA